MRRGRTPDARPDRRGEGAGDIHLSLRARALPSRPTRMTAGKNSSYWTGTLSDEFGDYPAGTYVRNPSKANIRRTARKAARSSSSCINFLETMQPERSSGPLTQSSCPAARPGLSVLPLHQVGTESVALVRWTPGTRFSRHRHWGGEEILVLEGVFQDEHGDYPAGTWLRNPHLSVHTPFSETGALIWVKDRAFVCAPCPVRLSRAEWADGETARMSRGHATEEVS